MNEEMRKEFEEFWKENMSVDAIPLHKTAYPFTLDEKQQYLCHETNRSWITWQASREAMKPIRLPMWCMTSDGPSKYLLQYEVIEAIQQAGYKVTP